MAVGSSFVHPCERFRVTERMALVAAANKKVRQKKHTPNVDDFLHPVVELEDLLFFPFPNFTSAHSSSMIE